MRAMSRLVKHLSVNFAVSSIYWYLFKKDYFKKILLLFISLIFFFFLDKFVLLDLFPE